MYLFYLFIFYLIASLYNSLQISYKYHNKITKLYKQVHKYHNKYFYDLL
jgi:hypothetical protein